MTDMIKVTGTNRNTLKEHFRLLLEKKKKKHLALRR